MNFDAPLPPPSEESQRAGHELSDVAIRPILMFVIGLIVFGGFVEVTMALVMQGYAKADTKVGVPNDKAEKLADKLLRDPGNPKQPPPLQRDTTADMVRMYAEEDAVLTTYKLNPATKQARIPLDRAMAIMAKKGLPHRDLPAGMVNPDANRIPTQGKAYQAIK